MRVMGRVREHSDKACCPLLERNNEQSRSRNAEGQGRIQQFQHLIFSPEHQNKPRLAFPQLMRTPLPRLHARIVCVSLIETYSNAMSNTVERLGWATQPGV